MRLLKLCNGTFQCLIRPQISDSSSNSGLLFDFLSPWIVQECFNIVCAATNVIVDECADIIRSTPLEKKKLVSGLVNLLLSVMSTPQSSVTHLRALGGASQTIDKFGSALFVECVADHLQHWMRVVLTVSFGGILCDVSSQGETQTQLQNISLRTFVGNLLVGHS